MTRYKVNHLGKIQITPKNQILNRVLQAGMLKSMIGIICNVKYSSCIIERVDRAMKNPGVLFL